MKQIVTCILWVCLLAFYSCVDHSVVTDAPIKEEVIAENAMEAALDVSDDFSYRTSEEVSVVLKVPDFLKKSIFTLYSKEENNDSIKFGSAVFDKNGEFNKTYTLAFTVDSILVVSDYVGLTDVVSLAVEDQGVYFDYNTLYDREADPNTEDKGYSGKASGLYSKTDFYYLSAFTGKGVPKDLVDPDDIDSGLLDIINASVPEGSQVPVDNPQYLAGAETNLILTKRGRCLG